MNKFYIKANQWSNTNVKDYLRIDQFVYIVINDQEAYPKYYIYSGDDKKIGLTLSQHHFNMINARHKLYIDTHDTNIVLYDVGQDDDGTVGDVVGSDGSAGSVVHKI